MSHRIAFFGFLLLCLAVAVGPFYSVPTYSSLRNTLSELAGQGMPGAWIMRAGFVGMALAAIALAVPLLSKRPWLALPVIAFGLAMLGAAIWSNLPIDPTIPGDPDEDWLHSFFASAMGTAFAASCAIYLFGPGGSRRDWLSWTGLVISVAIPWAMLNLPEITGLLQRIMFAFSILWFWQRVR